MKLSARIKESKDQIVNALHHCRARSVQELSEFDLN